MSLAGLASEIPDRVAGWGLASAVALLASAVLWPSPARNPEVRRQVLERTADVLEAPGSASDAPNVALIEMRDPLGALERAATGVLPAETRQTTRRSAPQRCSRRGIPAFVLRS